VLKKFRDSSRSDGSGEKGNSRLPRGLSGEAVEYDMAGVTSEAEAQELIEFTVELRSEVLHWRSVALA
jgi:hypothetical protein